MRLANFTLDQLKALPLRAIVAFAARCTRRVEPLAQLPEGDPQRESRRTAVDAALRMAESFARGTDAPRRVGGRGDRREPDAGGESAGSSAASAVAQAAHAAASAWHAGSRGGGGRGNRTRPGSLRCRHARHGRPRRPGRLHGRRGRVRLRRLPQRGLRRRGPARLRHAGPPPARPLSGAGGPGRPVPGRAAGPPVTVECPRCHPGGEFEGSRRTLISSTRPPRDDRATRPVGPSERRLYDRNNRHANLDVTARMMERNVITLRKHAVALYVDRSSVSSGSCGTPKATSGSCRPWTTPGTIASRSTRPRRRIWNRCPDITSTCSACRSNRKQVHR